MDLPEKISIIHIQENTPLTVTHKFQAEPKYF